MAEKNLTQTRRRSKTTRVLERPPVAFIDAAHSALKGLMTEQRRTGGGYATVYQGTRREFLEAGVPENAFALVIEIQLTNVCCTGDREVVSGSMREVDGIFELEIQWGHMRPYIQGAHPAITELARMMLIDLMRWTENYVAPDMEQPFAVLAADRRATDFKPCDDARKFKVTPQFHKVLREAAGNIYQLVHTHGEIMLAEPTPQPEQKRFSGNVVPMMRHKPS